MQLVISLKIAKLSTKLKILRFCCSVYLQVLSLCVHNPSRECTQLLQQFVGRIFLPHPLVADPWQQYSQTVHHRDNTAINDPNNRI